MRPPFLCLLAVVLAVAGCSQQRANRDLNREEAIAAVEAHMNKAERWPELKRELGFRPVAYERRTTWLITYLWEGGTGGPPTLVVDKRGGEILLEIGGGQ